MVKGTRSAAFNICVIIRLGLWYIRIILLSNCAGERHYYFITSWIYSLYSVR